MDILEIIQIILLVCILAQTSTRLHNKLFIWREQRKRRR